MKRKPIEIVRELEDKVAKLVELAEKKYKVVVRYNFTPKVINRQKSKTKI
jgi:hypothetical protein